MRKRVALALTVALALIAVQTIHAVGYAHGLAAAGQGQEAAAARHDARHEVEALACQMTAMEGARNAGRVEVLLTHLGFSPDRPVWDVVALGEED